MSLDRSTSVRRISYTTAIVREIPDSFPDALTLCSDNSAVNLDVARQQHAEYCRILSEHCQLKLHYAPCDNNYPDACFVEDTALVLPRHETNNSSPQAILLRPGHPSRVGEVDTVAATLEKHCGVEILADMRTSSSEATCDGGDVLCIGETWLFCGVHSRSTESGIRFLQQAVAPRIVVPIPMGRYSSNILHLKSIATALSEDAVVVYTNGRDADSLTEALESRKIHVYSIPDDLLACNVLTIQGTIVAQEHLTEAARRTLEQAATDLGQDLIHVDTTELAKKDGALTCCSILI